MSRLRDRPICGINGIRWNDLVRYDVVMETTKLEDTRITEKKALSFIRSASLSQPHLLCFNYVLLELVSTGRHIAPPSGSLAYY